MEAKPQVFAFESFAPKLVLELARKKGPSQIVEFLGHEFVTKEEDVAKELQEHPMFTNDVGTYAKFWPMDLTPQKPRFERPHNAPRVHSGARATA